METIEKLNTIWTIGHSTRTFEEFIEILKKYNIELLADVRRYPGSKRYPHFNAKNLQEQLAVYEIEYAHYLDLGGRRTPNPDSTNIGWRHTAFRGYADYMETASFLNAVHQLQVSASSKKTAYMCSEAPWWRCHRALISDFLKTRNWTVIHIMNMQTSLEHPFTSPASVVNGNLFYNNEKDD